MIITVKFDEGRSVIKHVEFSEGIILGLTTRDSDNNILEQEPLYLVNGFIFAYDAKAYTPEKVYSDSNFKEFEDSRKYHPNYIELGLNNIPEIRLQRALEHLGVGPDAKRYVKTLIDSTNPLK